MHALIRLPENTIVRRVDTSEVMATLEPMEVVAMHQPVAAAYVFVYQRAHYRVLDADVELLPAAPAFDGDGPCLNKALALLLDFDPNLPQWTPMEANRSLARQFGLQYYEGANLDLDESQAIVFVVATGEKRAHCWHIPPGDVGKFLNWNKQQILACFSRDPISLAELEARAV